MQTSLEADELCHIAVAQGSHVGLVRDHNEDAFAWLSTSIGELFIVADGMGGYEGGAEAARLAIDTVSAYVDTYSDVPLKVLLPEAVLVADKAISEASVSLSLPSMGSTLVALLIQGDRAFYLHVGDSRLYVLSDERLHQLTHDHSYVQELIDKGRITKKEAERHPERNVITQSMGSNVDTATLVMQEYSCKAGDSFLICTDGLSGMISDEDIYETLSMSTSPQARVDELIKKALDAGGKDNVTAILVDFDFVQPACATAAKAPTVFGPFIWGLLLGIVMGAGAFYMWQTWIQAILLPVAP